MKYVKFIPIIACLLVATLARSGEKPGPPETDSALDKQIRDAVFEHKPAILDIPVGWHEIRGLPGRSSWHILGTHWWVRLHPDHHGLEKLDKDKQYVVHGIPLEQNYGVIDIWAYKITEKK